jgi:hypothetical protein
MRNMLARPQDGITSLRSQIWITPFLCGGNSLDHSFLVQGCEIIYSLDRRGKLRYRTRRQGFDWQAQVTDFKYTQPHRARICQSGPGREVLEISRFRRTA